MRNVIVRYQIDPSRRDQHLGLLREVFAGLAAAGPAGLRYTASHEPDGVSFTHVARIDTPDPSNPLAAVPAFAAFTRGIEERCVQPPRATDVTVVGDYAGLDAATVRNQAMVRALAEEVFTAGHLDRVDQLVDPELIDHTAPEGMRDRDGFRRIVEAWRAATSDLRVRVVQLFGAGEWVGMVDETSGVHDRAPLFGIPPSGRRFRFGAVHAFRCRSGRMLEHWVETSMRAALAPGQAG